MKQPYEDIFETANFKVSMLSFPRCMQTLNLVAEECSLHDCESQQLDLDMISGGIVDASHQSMDMTKMGISSSAASVSIQITRLVQQG